MSKIRIKNFGPIKEGYLDDDGWLDVRKVTVFIGNQGSGKSTVAKLISTFSWMEKALTRGDYDKTAFERKDVFRKYLTYHKIEDYLYYPKDINPGNLKLHDRSEIEYEGNSYSFKYSSRRLEIKEQGRGKYSLPQIMYVPADRSFISTVDDLKSQRLFSPSLSELLAEYQNAKKAIEGELELPINGIHLEYDKATDVLYIKGKDYRLKLSASSSGFHSFVPLYLVTWFLANSVKGDSDITKEPMSSDELERYKKGIETIWADTLMTEDQRRAALSVLSSKFNKTAFINIVEEPELNLFPTSQREMLNSLLEFNNMNEGNELIMTTHSPYVINYLTLAVKAGQLETQIADGDLEAKLDEIVPLDSIVKEADLVIYELDETNGTIKKLGNYEGIPTDSNFLNNQLGLVDKQYDSLLEIEEEL